MAHDERCLKCSDECLLPLPHFLLSFSLCRDDKHLSGRYADFYRGVKGRQRKGAVWWGKEKKA